jgi:trehalose 6-phosphate phosphatase
LRAEPGRAAVLTDFDGTLAPIVTHADQAVPLPGALPVLGRLAARYHAVAVISGRPVSYLQTRLGAAPGLILAGLYGMERARDGKVVVLDEAAGWRDAVEKVAAAAEGVAPEGVVVERKGLGLSLHYRQAPHQRVWVERFAGDQAAGTGLVAHPGRQLVELLPPVTADKGTVVSDLASDAGAACYLGDDSGDLPAFAALAQLRRGGVHTVSIAVVSDEAPEALLDAADAVVDGPAGALGFLSALAE